ncbi:alginate lyase family protein [Defluviimonas sp. WL0075]|uniref:Alginate lyase family protein n=1 Tax=Albidovulum sediminicola TaxID=2984331 RepID=A0ABT2Z394_9RHOB|nr:alginate lyase family protein [Defluviimonas sp. WL0075]MCV2865563.1 alginate lyase family protein [Defluviimonas sp. WL0075]
MRLFNAIVFSLLASAMPAQASPLLSGGSGKTCAISTGRSAALPTVVNVPDAYTANTPDPVTSAMKAWADHIMRLGSNARRSSQTRRQLHDQLMAAAMENAMSWPSNWSQGYDRPPSTIYHTMETLFPALIAYGQNRDAFSPAERQRFEDWAGSIVDRLGRTPQIAKWKTDNKKYQFGALSAAYGVVTGKQAHLSKGVRIYKTAVRSMRKDGSLPGDTARGGSSLHYTNLALANLVAIAELATDADIDLYSYSSGEKSLHTAVGFLAAAQSDPSLIAAYARSTAKGTGSFKGYSAENQDRRWASEAKSSWGYYYLRRFGTTPSGKSLLAVSPFLRAGKAGIHQQSGGNARCFVSG